MTDPPSPDLTLDQRRLLLEQVEGSLKVQSDEIDGLDRKATTVLAATGVLLGLVINNTDHFSASPCPVPWVYYGALVVLAAGLIFGVYALWPQKFRFVPEPRPFLDEHATKMPAETMGVVVNTKADAYALNHKVARTKGDRLRIQMVLRALGGGLLVGAYILERLV